MSFPLTRLLAALLLLAACEDPHLEALNHGPRLPPGIKPVEDSVDGLVVGHRLMAAGEYELALKEYYLAASEHGLNADVLSALGSANLKLGRLGQAERLLRLATEKDEDFAAAWNNLGVVLMEQGETGEAARTFRIAFALDSGQSVEIRQNLRVALARMEEQPYSDENEQEPYEFELVRRGQGEYRILSTP